MEPIYSDVDAGRSTVPIYDDPPSRGMAVRTWSRISWGAVLAGVVMALAVHLVLTLLGTAIGLSTVEPAQYDSPSVEAFSIGAGFWWQVSALISLFVGGWTAGRLAGLPGAKDSLLHGLLTWGVTTVISAYLLSSAIGNLVGATGNALQGVARGAGQAISAVAPEIADQTQRVLEQQGIDLDRLHAEAMRTLRQTGQPALQPEALENRAENAGEQIQGTAANAARSPQTADAEFDALFDRLFHEGEEVAAQADREALINVVAARTGQSREEATATVAQWEQQYQQLKARAAEQAEKLKAEARVAAEATAKTVARASFWGMLGLILGAIAAALGAKFGRPKTLTQPVVI